MADATATADRRAARALGRLADWARDRWAPIALSLAAGLAVFLLATTLFPYLSVNHDEAVYLQQADLLLEGRIAMTPAEPGAVRPWFFVRDGGRLYPKYAPVPAAAFALGRLLTGSYRVALAGIGAGVVGLTYAVTAAAFDRRTGLLAGGLLLATPTFLLTAPTFLPYAVATLLNLAFAFAYVRAARAEGRRSVGYALAAGLAVGVAFFGRPYTTVLFAAPFVGHALLTLGRAARARDRSALRGLAARHGATAAVGLAFVGATVAYNAAATGSPWLFPFEAFAPLDGLGFGQRRIVDHAVDYTPALALRANAVLLWEFATRWTVAAPLGTGLFAVGVGRFLLGRDRTGDGGAGGVGDRERASEGETANDDEGAGGGDPGSNAGSSDRGTAGRSTADPTTGLPDRTLRWILVGVLASVVVGNLYFWGAYNVLGDLPDPTDGFMGGFGPFYHFDALVPLAAFGAAGALALWDRLRRALGERIAAADRRRVALGAVLAAVLLVGAGAEVAALDRPVSYHAAYTDRYAEAYGPIEDREFEDALVFVPSAYGPWLNHPFQSLRNDAAADGGLEGPVVYARDRDPAGDFAVLAAYDRTPYRYNYRGAWAPDPSNRVDPKLRRLAVREGETVTVATTVATPPNARSASVRLGIAGESVWIPLDDPRENVTVRWRLDADGARVVGVTADGTERSLAGAASERVSLSDPREVALAVTFATPDGATLTYRQELDARPHGGGVQVIWPPESSVCPLVPDCGLEGTYLPNHPELVEAGAWMDATVSVAGGGDGDE
jgi:hypothetical protein